ncbi:uncharacterized protein LOC104892884 isoform X1 [Beta vulgaris subsp. vulgaris]|uniref:uncharacterized protein LOC104892884 isoform X1 n=1 Tax=Beta vulgaris subsp. vulgaris TaxID=3555 RepID=UPI00203674FF|nr:uncharacterized protein LOC104892884 isoform X1 [Beta vulgaris subsp. vulgaris]
MAATTSSPVLSNNGSEASGNTGISSPPPSSTTPPSTVKSPSLPTILLQRPEPPKNLRGLNKPKCIKCGNVARSRCPYQSCKSCCSKAQNPCHIHVLKQNSTLADRGASSNSTIPEQQPNEVAASGPQSKATSLRQLSSTFSQLNNVHIPRSRKPLTRKEALTVNEWRFAKLKEYKERNVEAENEAFDRYMQNIGLLEEVFDVNSERTDENVSGMSNPPTTSGEKMEIISETKVMLRSNPERINTFRKRIRQTIDQGLRKFQTNDLVDGPSNLDDEDDMTPKTATSMRAGKTSALAELNFKLNRARNEEDLKLCVEMRSNILGQQNLTLGQRAENAEVLEKQTVRNHLPSTQESDVSLKLVKTTEIDQDLLNSMDSHFSSLEEIEDL